MGLKLTGAEKPSKLKNRAQESNEILQTAIRGTSNCLQNARKLAII